MNGDDEKIDWDLVEEAREEKRLRKCRELDRRQGIPPWITNEDEEEE